MQRSRTPTCGAAAHQEHALTFCSCAELETEGGQVSEPLFSEQQCENTCMTLTRCASASAGTLKLQELDVDLEILLLSFLTVILQEKQHQQTASSTVYLTNKDGDMTPPTNDYMEKLPGVEERNIQDKQRDSSMISTLQSVQSVIQSCGSAVSPDLSVFVITHTHTHTCPSVPPLESLDWTAALMSPPASGGSCRSSSAH